MVVAFTICFPWFEMHDIICQFSYFTANQWSEKRELQPETSYLLPGNANAAEVWWSYWRNIQNCMCLKYRITCLLKRLFNGKVTCFMWASRKKYFIFFLKFEEGFESSGTPSIIISGLQVQSTLLPVYKGKEVILVMQ